MGNGTIDGNGIERWDLDYFETESPEMCKQDCEGRNKCGAWSYDKVSALCYLHTVDSCCGQFTKRELVPGFMSGYVCKSCWSTRGECPCTVEERLKKTGTAHSTGGGTEPLHNNPTGVGFVTVNPLNVDVCACVQRAPKGRRKNWICVKPVCKDAETNPDGLCDDTRRCRKFPRKEKTE